MAAHPVMCLPAVNVIQEGSYGLGRKSAWIIGSVSNAWEYTPTEKWDTTGNSLGALFFRPLPLSDERGP